MRLSKEEYMMIFQFQIGKLDGWCTVPTILKEQVWKRIFLSSFYRVEFETSVNNPGRHKQLNIWSVLPMRGFHSHRLDHQVWKQSKIFYL